ncbi:hypothetical protein C6Y14_43180 [Streptomyces dioscori]|uniref:Uncharacterized protein n=1 Tax=Streptomyces dioscori TaxID=2109333 RepID=A0A2P8PTE7_9ACTN|nr:DUF6415 family natural product biosynthesis protein [Streptomyces dioscori]PSM37271.1 hypothetical protein C6Y14_43180 [Streptomyces dioscori]
MDDGEYDTVRDHYDSAFALTAQLPGRVPSRVQIDVITAALREDIAAIKLPVRDAVKRCVRDIGRETAYWLLTNARAGLSEGPGETGRAAAFHAEDLGHVARAMAAIGRQKRTVFH